MARVPRWSTTLSTTDTGGHAEGREDEGRDEDGGGQEDETPLE